MTNLEKFISRFPTDISPLLEDAIREAVPEVKFLSDELVSRIYFGFCSSLCSC